MNSRDNILFYEHELSNILGSVAHNMVEKVNSIPETQFLATSDKDIVEHIHSAHFIEPLTLHEDSMEMQYDEIKIDVSGYRDRNPSGRSGSLYFPGIRITITIPYIGEPILWKSKPNVTTTVFPHANVHKPKNNQAGYIEFVFEQPADAEPELFKKRLDSELKDIRFYIMTQRKQVEQFNTNSVNTIEKAIQARKERLKKKNGLVELLNIPLKKRDGAPPLKPIKIERKLVKPLPPPPQSGLKPEPGITDENYEFILSIIRHVGRTFESTPETYSVHDEEDLRNIILSHLNGHFQGGATGETFRRRGKTDIRIEDTDRAAFIAECKIWRGNREFTVAIDQLLSYLTWRDCKAAIIIFNMRNAKFTELLAKIPNILQSHPKFISDLGQQENGEWRCIFSSQEDESRHITINVFIFNLYVA